MKNQESKGLLTYVFMGIVIAVITSMLFSCSTIKSNCCGNKPIRTGKAVYVVNKSFNKKHYNNLIKHN